MVLAVLKEAGASQILPGALHEYFGATVSQCELFAPAETAEIADAIASACTAKDRVRIFETFLLRARRPHRADSLVGEALSRIHGETGRVTIGELAKSLGLSRDRFEKRFRGVVGTTAGHYVSLLRFERARACACRVPSLSELAQASGYYDQSHFIRECRRLTGQSPSRFFGRSEFC
jgi:AraC-like DNA-binding protein